MKKTTFAHLVLIIYGIVLSCNLEKIELGDVPTATFERHFGGSDGDNAFAAVELSDGNFILAGYGANELIKINGKTGDNIRSYKGASGSSVFWLDDLVKINNDKILVCGFRFENQVWKGMVARFDSSLTREEEVNSGATTTFPNFDWFRQILQASDGSYRLLGINNNIPFIGSMLTDFSSTPGSFAFSDYYLHGNGFRQTKEGSFIFTTGKQSINTKYLIKTKKNVFFEVDWSMPFDFVLGDVIQTEDGHFILAGLSNDMKPQFAVVSPSQSVLYNAPFGTREGSFRHVIEVDDGYLFVGNISPGENGGHDDNDVYIVKTDKDGKL
ncbi:MAG: hypothetical protein L6Q97_09655 [Thermoanaerobaculia bacterium]|nr:hypothetical protein [Thermoanaerobaculia bacterium]